MLDRGELDLALGSLAAPAEHFSDIRLFDDRFACILRQSHPGIADGALDALTLADTPHLEITSTGEGTGFVDDELRALGLERRIALRAPLHVAAPVLAQSDMVAVMAERAAQAFAARAPLQVVPLPLKSPSITVCMLWHRRVSDQPGHRWLRGLVSRLARTPQP
jgi:DNA-binding transcriptional LysR family regulator